LVRRAGETDGNGMSVLAVIPARGGSKGIPHKNLKEIAGKPLVAWMIEAAIAAPSVHMVAVSTDDVDILALADDMNVYPVDRPKEISGDTAASELAVIDALMLRVPYRRVKENYSTVLMLQPTSPLTLPEDIEGVLAALDAPAGTHTPLQFDSAFSVTPFDKFLWHDMGVDKGVVGINHEKTKPREMRQQRYGQFLENGAVYAMRTGAFLKAKNRFCGYSNTYVMPKERSIEIDDMADWVMAEALLEQRVAV
jgi:CMP-N-acetylneuraminic acid synthetase